jgi:protein TonB
MKEGFMLAYAPRPERRRASPAALALIIGAHAAAIVAVMSARLEVQRHRDPPIKIDLIEQKQNPKPDPQPPKPHQSTDSRLTAPHPLIDPPPLPGPTADPLPPDPLPPLGPGPVVDPAPIPRPTPIVHSGPRFATPPDDIRPPYPEAMRALEKEAVLRLRLAIDERGRVVAVEPVGNANPVFLAAARRHILKAWRYTPARDGDHAIASSTVITLEFKLDS